MAQAEWWATRVLTGWRISAKKLEPRKPEKRRLRTGDTIAMVKYLKTYHTQVHDYSVALPRATGNAQGSYREADFSN